MSRGFSTNVVMRLWNEVRMIRTGMKRAQMLKKLDITSRQLSEDLKILKRYDLEVKYRKSNDTHVVNWPSRDFPISLDEEEFFVLFLVINTLHGESGEFKATVQKLYNAIDFNEAHMLDLASGALSNSRVNELQKEKVRTVMSAIRSNRKLSLIYRNTQGKTLTKKVSPIRVIHTPMSYYLYAYSEEKDHIYRLFKLARIEGMRCLNEAIAIHHDIPENEFNDSWYVVTGGPVQKIKVLFKGGAAQAIKEYQLHSSQLLKVTTQGTEVSWDLCENSMLSEFATWLIGWAPDIKVLQPQALNEHLRQRMLGFLDEK